MDFCEYTHLRTIWAHTKRREKKTRIAERRKNLVKSLFLSLSSKSARHVLTPTKNGRVVGHHRPILSNSKRAANSNPNEFQFVRARIGHTNRISTRHHPKRTTTTTTTKGGGREKRKRRVRTRTFARLFVLRKEKDCVFCGARIREFKREKRRRKKPLNGKKTPPPKKEKQLFEKNHLYVLLSTISYVDAS